MKMFNKFWKKAEKRPTNSKVHEIYYLPGGFDESKVKVFYEGEVLSPEYVATTLVLKQNGKERQNFNDQDYPYHNLFPHGEGRIFYKHGDTVIEEYEGEFEAGQYHGTGKLVDLNGEIFEGTFLENKFKDK